MLATAMSLISGLSRCTAMSRLRSSANFTASSRARANAFDLVHLPHDRRFVRVGGNQPRELGLLLVQFLPLLPKQRNRGLEDGVDPRGLVVREAQVFLELSVAPPGEAERLCASRDRHCQ